MLIIRRLISLAIIVILIGLNCNLLAQIWLDDNAIYKEAEGYMDGEEFDEAIPLFQLLEKKGVSNANISCNLGICYLKTIGKKTLSIPYFEDAIINATSTHKGGFSDSTAPLKAFVYLGIAYRIDNKFEKSIQSFERYKDSTIGTEFEQLADYYINQTRTAMFFTENPSRNKLIKLKANSPYSLSSPVLTNDSVIFFMESKPFYNAVVSGYLNNYAVNELENMTPVLGNEEDITIVSISPDGNKFIFTAYVIGKGYELFFSDKDSNGQWGKYEVFPEPINTPGNESFASVTASGKVMYFSSNKHGGFGGSDIYRTELIGENKWSDPINIGNKVNTAFNEVVCSVSPDGEMLFINSEGHLNMGGFDLFYTQRDSLGNWNTPTNFGSPVSTSDDDNFLSVSSQNKMFTSRYVNKSAGKEELQEIVLTPESLQKKVLVKTQLAFNDEILPREVSYIIHLDETEVIERSVTNENGTTQKFLNIGSYVYDYIYNDNIRAKQKVVITSNMSADVITLDFPEWEIDSKTLFRRVLTLKDILFEFNSYKLSDSYFTMLDSVAGLMLLDNVTSIIIEGHTDALGSKNYNESLSHKRAEAVGQYLLNKGVIKDKLILQGKGEELPVAINNNPDGTDNSFGRKYNRRVSIAIESKEQGIVIQRTNQVPIELILK